MGSGKERRGRRGKRKRAEKQDQQKKEVRSRSRKEMRIDKGEKKKQNYRHTYSLLRHFSLGRARIEYCALVGLTTDYITFGADLARLRIASDNLNLLATDEVLVLPSFPATQIEMYRKAILEFLQRS